MLILLLLTALQGSPTVGSDPSSYIIGPNDVLAVNVFNQAQLSGRFPVGADGTLAFPLLGRVMVGGLTVGAVEDELRRRLAAGYVKDPRINVTIEQSRSQLIFIIGEVRQPGALPLTGSMTLIEALARAGSTTERAGMEAMIVRPRSGGSATAATLPTGGDASNAETIHVDLKSLQTGVLSQNIALRPGDTIFVPRADTVFVLGQVKTAGEYVLRRGMTVRQLLALAGGMTERASTRRIQVIRQVNGKETTISVNMQTLVQSGDTIVVRDRLF